MDKRRSVRLSVRLAIVTMLVVLVVVVLGFDSIHAIEGYAWWSIPYLLYVFLIGVYAAILCGVLGYGVGRRFVFPVTKTQANLRPWGDSTNLPD